MVLVELKQNLISNKPKLAMIATKIFLFSVKQWKKRKALTVLKA